MEHMVNFKWGQVGAKTTGQSATRQLPCHL